jgi:hypothetical protein
VVSNPSIGFKIKADRDGQPQEYREYFEDWTSQYNTEIESEGRFETTSKKKQRAIRKALCLLMKLMPAKKFHP